MDRLNGERLGQLLDAATRVRALVVGDLMLDVYLRGDASRISPEAPVPVVRVAEQWRALGGAANVVGNVRALGADCAVVGVVGEDAAGAGLREELRALDADVSGVVVSKARPTTVKTRILSGHHQVARYDMETDRELGSSDVDEVVGAIDRAGAAVDVIILEDYDKGLLVPAVIEAALDAGRTHDVPVVVDPKARHFFDYPGATLFKPNRTELASALRAVIQPESAEWMDRTRRHLECANLLVTMGEDGMALMTESGEHVRVPTVARSVYDVSGAGDTVIAATAVAMAAGASVVEAAMLANHAAGIEVGRAGVTTVSAAELMKAVREHERTARASS